MVSEQEIRNAVQGASARFAQNYVVVAMPKTVVADYVEVLNSTGLDVDVVDDGEDDGIPALVVVPRPAKMGPVIDDQKRQVRYIAAMFLGLAVMATLARWLDVVPLIYASWFLLANSGWGWWRAHADLERQRRRQKDLQAKGY